MQQQRQEGDEAWVRGAWGVGEKGQANRGKGMVPDKGPEEEGERGDRLGEDGEVAGDDDDAVLGEQRSGGEHDLCGRGGREQRRERLAARAQRVVGAAHGLGDVVAVRVVRVHAQALAAPRHGTAHERLRELGHGGPRGTAAAAAARALEAGVRPADHGAPEGEPRVPRDHAQRRGEPVRRGQALCKAEERAAARAPGIGRRHDERSHAGLCLRRGLLRALRQAVEVGVAQARHTRGRHAAVLRDRRRVRRKALRQPHLQPPGHCHWRVQRNVREQWRRRLLLLPLLLLLLLHEKRQSCLTD